MLAVLEDAVEGYGKSVGKETPQARRFFLETYRWVESTSRKRLFAFQTICDVLDLNVRAIRRTLRLVKTRVERMRDDGTVPRTGPRPAVRRARRLSGY